MGIPKAIRKYSVEEYYDLEEDEVYKSEFKLPLAEVYDRMKFGKRK